MSASTLQDFLLENLKPALSAPERLWNSDDCAAFLRMSRRHFMERVKWVRSFPRPRYLPTMQGRSRPLWNPAEVRTAQPQSAAALIQEE